MYSIPTDTLPDSLIAPLENLELLARHIVEGFITGLHKSPFHGFSVEFSQHRAYMQGDDLKHIDWKVLARKEKYFVKQYEEETNARVYILLDISRSMTFSANGRLSKLNYAKVLSAALSYMLIRQRDAVGMYLFSDRIYQHYPVKSLPNYYNYLARQIHNQAGQGAAVASAVLHELAERIHRRSMVIIISDLMDDSATLLEGIRHLHHNKHDIIVFTINDPLELQMDLDGSFLFEDLESHVLKIKTETRYIREAYLKRIRTHYQQIKTHTLDMGGAFIPIQTDQKIEKALYDFLSARHKQPFSAL
ncbi:MAG: DUF58 domain-containing protein [Calditrichaeota bacterium]|nr:MAG: DUF58 domain-containing protein [Calditrichota bacterium]